MSNGSLKSLFEGRLVERRYRLVRLLSEGNFGGVFHARLEIFGDSVRDVALKITKNTQLDKESARSLFAEAATLIRVYDQITDPLARNHIVPVYDLGLLEEHERRGFIVMALIHGVGSTAERFQPPDTLGHEISRYKGGMAPAVAIEFFRQICTGLEAVHELRVIHRDLKPDNILLTDQGQIRIVDFGLAAGLNDIGGAAGTVGTHRYMAPETALHGHSDPSSDVYSLGIILYEMLTGSYPFAKLVAPPGIPSSDREMWVLDQKRRFPLTPPADRRRDVPKWLSALVMDCLRFRADDGRPASAGELLKRLQRGEQSREAQVSSRLTEVRAILSQGTAGELRPDWAQAAVLLEEASGQCPDRTSANWFDVRRQLALCYIHLEAAGRANEIMRELDQAIDGGDFLHSYRERFEFYDAFAKALEGKRGMGHWSIQYRQKATKAGERAKASKGSKP